MALTDFLVIFGNSVESNINVTFHSYMNNLNYLN